YDPAAFPELAEYELALHPPLEGQLIDLADEIAYNTADLDDGYEARLLDRETILEAVPMFRHAFDEVRRRYPQAAAKLQFNEALKRVIDRLVTDLIENTKKVLAAEGIKTLNDVRRSPRRLVDFSPAVAEENRALKQFLYQRLYAHPNLIGEREQAVKALEELFRFYLDHPQRLPRFYYEKTRAEPAHRVVCDYIAGMTDTYVFRQQRELLEAAPSLLESTARTAEERR
ncbi:MAG: deoxyguanosinetriphosphate triphosphohydrolase, partial [Acidobacteria bacterium]|nr:deoxyguanosinetriphosphate triphosphohydrolase [Acidobacteriota bacterium]